MKRANGLDQFHWHEALDRAYATLLAARPTAINLKWALEEMMAAVRNRPRAERTAVAYRRAALNARAGAMELLNVFTVLQMTRETFEHRAFTRLKQLKHLLDRGALDDRFRWKLGSDAHIAHFLQGELA